MAAKNGRRCKCGENLITTDERQKNLCWDCQGLERRLSNLDHEIQTIEATARANWMAPRVSVSAAV